MCERAIDQVTIRGPSCLKQALSVSITVLAVHTDLLRWRGERRGASKENTGEGRGREGEGIGGKRQ